MSIPYVKRRHNINSGIIADTGPTTIIPFQGPALQGPAVQGPAAPRRGPPSRPGPRQPRKSLAGGTAALLVIIAGLMVVPGVSAETFTDGFEDDTLGLPPTGEFYTTVQANSAQFFVSNSVAFEGTQSAKMVPGGSGTPRFVLNDNLCGSTGGIEFKFYVEGTGAITDFAIGVANTAASVGVTFPSISLRITSGVATMALTGSNAGEGSSAPFAVPPPQLDRGVWHSGELIVNCGDGTAASTSQGTFVLDGAVGFVTAGDFSLAHQAQMKYFGNGLQSNGAGGATTYYDLLVANSNPAPDSNQIAVNDLVGYSMDNSGRTIITREDFGEEISAYSASTLIQTGTTTTPNCGIRFDGVLAVELEDEIFLSYVDCDVGGDSDAFRVRNSALGPPNFPDGEFDTGCSQQNQDNENDGDTDIPNEVGEVGMVLDMPINFNRCSDTGIDYAAAAWTFAELNGKLGIYAVLYINNAQDQQDKADVQLDTNPSPDIAQFCSWHNYGDGNDYVGGVASNGPVGIYEATSDIITVAGVINDVETQLTQRFLNNGQYGSSIGIACAGNKVAILQSDELHLLTGVLNGSAQSVSGFPKTITAPTADRGVAITGSGRFIAYVSGGSIHVIWASNGTETVSFPVPSGSFRGMEFDNAGEKLAVFTNDFITVYETATVTCELSGTCGTEGGQGDDDNPNPTPSTSTGPGGGGGIGDDEIIDSPYFWVLVWIGVFEVLVALLSYLTRGGFPGIVYGVVAIVIYTIGIIFAGIEEWPLIAPVVVVIGLAIARFRS